MTQALRSRFAMALLLALGACGAASNRSASGVPGAAAGAIDTELKATIRADQVDAARELFELDDPRATRTEVAFYDSPSLELYAAGLILRSRKVDGGDDDTTVKLRPLARSAVAPSWLDLEGFKSEEDRTGTTSVESCSLTESRSARAIDEVAAGARSIESLFSDEQRDFARDYARVAPDWSRLKVLGPVVARSWEFRLPELETRLSAELWTLPDGQELLELSTRVRQPQASQIAAEIEAALRSRGFDTSAGQEAKTRAALEALAAR